MQEETTFLWSITGQAVIGTSHLRSDLPCQDAYLAELNPDFLVLVVSDGAGSARYAEQGAQIVTRESLAILRRLKDMAELPSTAEQWEKILCHYLVEKLRIALQAEAKVLAAELSDFACTFLLAIVKEDALIGLQIGDGGIVYGLAENPDLSLLFMPTHGEYINETYFITASHYQQSLHFQYLEGKVNRIAVFSDGLEMLALNKQVENVTVFTQFFEPFFAFMHTVKNEQERMEKLANFLASERVCARTDDDKTLVLAVRSVGCVQT